MTVLNVAMFGSDELAREVAKPTDQRDVHTYVHKEVHSDTPKIISIIRPARYPDRLRPLLNAISVAKVGLIEINRVDAVLGEVLVAFASSSIKKGVAVIKPHDNDWIDREIVEKMFVQAGLDDWSFMQFNGIEIRNQLLLLMDEVSARLKQSASAPLVVPIDQHFNVKGIGVVAIGYIQCGNLKVHDEIYILPARDNGSTKSLQVMDDDVKMAIAGDRVGIALRNIKDNSLSNGSIIVKPAIHDKKSNTTMPLSVIEHSTSKMQLTTSPFQKRVLAIGDVIHISLDLQFVVGRIESFEGEDMIVKWESPVYVRRENPQKAIIAQLDSKPRILGFAKLDIL